jgi:hypothetical protein
MNICILQLEDNKYFVGSTNYLYVQEIIKDFKTRKNVWLETYPIIKIIKVLPIQYFGTTKEEKNIELFYEVKKIMEVMISRFSIENVQSEINISQVKEDQIIPIKTIIKNNYNYITEAQWYEDFDRQQLASSMSMFSSPACGELYHNSNNLNLEWNKGLEEEPKSPFETFYLKNYNIDESMLKSSYL